MMVTRETIIESVRKRLERSEFVLACWEAGSAAFGRIDRFSDIDLMIVADGDQILETFTTLEMALNEISSIQDFYELPWPTWHGHRQKFYRLREGGEFLILDVLVMGPDAEDRFLATELHGEPQILFDKIGFIEPPDFDPVAHRGRLQARIDQLGGMIRLLGNLSRKEILRGHPLDALSFYRGLLLKSLIELLRIRYDPKRHNFGARYLYYDLPSDAVKRLETLMFVGSVEELGIKQKLALDWFWALHEELEGMYA